MIDIDIVNIHSLYRTKKVLTIKYRFKNMPYLVCDKYGNFFILPHCPKFRTIPFKQLDKSKGYIYYSGNKIRMHSLRIRAYNVNEEIEI